MPKPSARCVVVHDQKLLAVLRVKGSLKFLSLPGGTIEDGETANQAASRETLEETDIKVDRLKQIYEWSSEDWGYQTFFLGHYVSGGVKLPDGSIEARIQTTANQFIPAWVPFKDFDRYSIFPETKEVLLAAGINRAIIDKLNILEVEED